MKIRLLSTVSVAIFLFCFLMLSGCTKKEQGKVVGFGQKMSGVVQSYIKVELSDGSEVKAWLPPIET